MGKITTGLDKLLRLLEEKGKLSIAEAAARLGIEEEVITEWVELLEHEKLVATSYRFSKQFVEIKEQDATKKVEVNAKKVSTEKEAFHRKIESAIHDLKKDTAGFDTLKKQYERIQHSVKDELESVRTQMKELDRFEKMRGSINDKIKQQKDEYKKFTKAYEEVVSKYDVEYNAFTAKLTQEEKRIKKIKDSIKGLRDEKEATEKSVLEGIEKLKKVSHDLNEKLHDLSAAEKRVSTIDQEIQKLEKGAEKSKEQFIVNLSKKIGQRKEALDLEQEELLRSTKDRVKHIKEYADSGRAAYDRFSSLFMDKIKTLNFFEDISKEKEKLLKELQDLSKKVDALSVTSAYAKNRKQIGDIETVIQKYMDRKSVITKKINDLIKFIQKD